MKTRIIRKIGVLATLLCLALMGCDMGNTSHDAKPTEAKGAVRVIVGAEADARGASRTVVPANPEFIYTLSFSAAGRTTVTAALDGNAGEVTLNTGTWTLSVTGKKNGETIAESDPVSVTVSEEGTTVSVIVHPTLNGAKGTFRYAVSADAALSEVSAVLTPLNVGNAEQSAITLTLGSTVEQSVAPGYYRLTVRALKGVQPLIRRETVHVYSSTETYKSYTLAAGDLAAVIYLGGGLSGSIAGYTPVAVAAYDDAAGSVPIDESAVSEGWRLAVEDTLGTVYFKVKLEKDGETYYSKLITVSDIPASGRLDIELAIEGYTITFDANGGAFENGGDTITMTALENETLTLPTASQSGREFAGWYSAGERFTAETRVRGDTTLYAEWALGAADIAAYLANAEGGKSAANPVPLVVSTYLAHGGWESLLATINTGGKYVSLDLSMCIIDETEFVPGTYAGANRVAALVLPDAAKRIPAGTAVNATFKAFTALGSLSGAGVETIGSYAFYERTSLASVSLPAATSIGWRAFRGCTNLASVSLPAATGIGNEAFAWCESLEAVNLPVAQTIGNEAFAWCESLEAVNLPVAQTIGNEAFWGCTSLASVSLPAAPPSISTGGYNDIFLNTGSGGTIIVSVPAGAVSAYTSAWGVSASTSAGGNTAKYGSNHKAVFITDAAPLTGLDGLADAPGGDTTDNPVSLTLSGSFTNDSWRFTLAVINGVGKYVSLDLSACTMTETAFTPGTYAGANRVTALVLPNAAKSIPAGTSSSTPFSAFTALRSLSGAGVETIGDYAFSGRISLTSVSLPAATDIGTQAFYGCTSLTSVSLPAATDIGASAFNGCTSLAGVSLPAATSIGNYAFGVGTSLATVSLPATPPSISSIFFYTGSSGAITVRVPAGAVSAYTSAWGVDANTPAGGNPSVYGSSHKAVVITDATPLTGLDGLADAPGGNTADNPVSLTLSGSLTNDSWAITLTVIAGAGKYVSLDLSACTMTETEFDPGTSTTGANRVTALVLPNVAKSIPAGSSDYAPFSAFTNLTSLSGAGVETIGAYALSYCYSLESVSLPAATGIGTYAFYNCTSLETASLPVAITIGELAFRDCTSLAEVSLHAATSIGAAAFRDCTSLALMSLSATPPSISAIFFYTGSSGTITVRVPAGAVSAYTSAWGVNESTSAVNGYDSTPYGSYHKAVIITDAAPLTGLDGLANASGGDTADNPVSLTLSGSFTNGSWALTLAAIAEAGKYVSLDLSACTMAETASAAGDYAGANRVTALVLPNTAKSIYAFSAFTALASLSGAGVETIGTDAFSGCISLTSVSLPAATTIGNNAFYQCTSLTTVSLPATPPSIGGGIFDNTGYSGTITVSVPADVVFAYTSEWGVSASTSAGGNTSIYGSNHKAVLITDAVQ